MKRRWIVGPLVAVVLAAVVVGNLQRARGKAVEVELATVGKRELVARVSGSGRIEARKSVSVTANVVGKVVEVAVAEGDVVKKGQLILRVDPEEKQSFLRQAEADVERWKAEEVLVRAELKQALAELRREGDLQKGGLSSDRDFETRRTAKETTEARLNSIQQQLKNARAALDYTRKDLDKTEIRAEISGVVVRLAVEEGENVLAGDLYNAGSSIVEVADLSQMEAHVLVDETEVVQVKKGQPAEVQVDAFPDQKLSGQVCEVGNSAYNPGSLGSQESKDFRVKVLLDSTSAVTLRPGLSVSAKIETDRREQALAVPIEALTIRNPTREAEHRLVNEGKKKESKDPDLSASGKGPESEESDEVEGVFVVEGERAVFREVKTGIPGEKDFEVVSGLDEGEKIVRGPFEALRKLKSGEKIRIAKAKKPKKGEASANAEADTEASGK